MIEVFIFSVLIITYGIIAIDALVLNYERSN